MSEVEIVLNPTAQFKIRGEAGRRILVETALAQTLTNKTLTAPVLTAPVITGALTVGAGAVLTSPTITGAIETETFATISGDGAITIVSGNTYLTKGSAAAVTIAAPGAAGIGVVLTIHGGSDFAHVVTFTGATLHDGTSGGHSLWTSAAFQGSSLTVIGVTAVKWSVVANNLGVITTP